MDTTTEELLIGYALDLLEPAEQQAAEHYIARHPDARRFVLEWQSTAHHVALAAPVVRPRPQTKQQLMQKVQAPKQPTRSVSRTVRRLSLGWAMVLIACLGLGGWNLMLRSENTQLRADNQALARSLDDEKLERVRLTEKVADADAIMKLMSSKDVTSRTLEATASAPNAKGTMFMQPGNQTAFVVVDGLAPLPEDRVYQFWLAREGQPPIPSNTFNVGADGHAELVIEANAQVNDFKQVMITVEPKSGSTVPGSTVLEGNL